MVVMRSRCRRGPSACRCASLDALLTSLLLPVHADAHVRRAVRRRDRGRHEGLRHLRRPGRDPALRGLRVGDDRGERLAGHVGRDHRPLPLDGRRRPGRAGRPRGGERRAQRRVDRARASASRSCSASGRSATSSTGSRVAGILLAFVVAVSWLAAAIGLVAGSPEAANGFTFLVMFLPYASSAFVPVDTMPDVAAGLRRAPAGHAGHRDAPGPAARHARGRRPVDRAGVVRGDPRRVGRGGRRPVRAAHRLTATGRPRSRRTPCP